MRRQLFGRRRVAPPPRPPMTAPDPTVGTIGTVEWVAGAKTTFGAGDGAGAGGPVATPRSGGAHGG